MQIMQININESDISQSANILSSTSNYESNISLSNGRTTNSTTISSRMEPQTIPAKSNYPYLFTYLDVIEAKTKLFGK